MGLSEEERQAIVAYRKQKAIESLQEAKDNFQLNHWSLVANRLYYAVYYVVTALMIKDGLHAKTHAGVQALLSKEYVSSNKITEEERRLFGRLFQMRQTGDYDDCFDYEKEDVEPLIPSTENLINKIITIFLSEESAT